jgi:hypothetical protein
MLPPFYADMPKSFDEIVESERRYLLRKTEKPLQQIGSISGKASGTS